MMGNLTDDMTRLRGEIDALRDVRGALMHDLAQGAQNLAGEVYAMRAGFAKNQAAKTRMAKEERRAFVSGMVSTVASLLDDFSSSHVALAKSDRAEREGFVADVKQTVASLLEITAKDLAGARRVWHGPTVAEKRAVKEAELREGKRREAEARRRRVEMDREAEARRSKEQQLQKDAEVKRLAEEAETEARKRKEEQMQREAEHRIAMARGAKKETGGSKKKPHGDREDGKKGHPGPHGKKGKI